MSLTQLDLSNSTRNSNKLLQLLSGKQPTWFISMGANAKDKDRVAAIKKDTFNGAHSASLFLSSNTTQFFAQPIPDYSARGDLRNRSFFIYKGTAPVAEVNKCLCLSIKPMLTEYKLSMGCKSLPRSCTASCELDHTTLQPFYKPSYAASICIANEYGWAGLCLNMAALQGACCWAA